MTETSSMPINAPCRRVESILAGPHPVVRINWLCRHADGTSHSGSLPDAMTTPRAREVADYLDRHGDVDVWFTTIGRVG